MKFTVGKQEYELSRKQIELAMKRIEPDSIQLYSVNVLDFEYPPKQVFAKVTGRRRNTFTSHEAVRVLSKLGFGVKYAGKQISSTLAQDDSHPDEVIATSMELTESRITAIENGLIVFNLALAGFQRRLEVLEKKV